MKKISMVASTDYTNAHIEGLFRRRKWLQHVSWRAYVNIDNSARPICFEDEIILPIRADDELIKSVIFGRNLWVNYLNGLSGSFVHSHMDCKLNIVFTSNITDFIVECFGRWLLSKRAHIMKNMDSLSKKRYFSEYLAMYDEPFSGEEYDGDYDDVGNKIKRYCLFQKGYLADLPRSMFWECENMPPLLNFRRLVLRSDNVIDGDNKLENGWLVFHLEGQNSFDQSDGKFSFLVRAIEFRNSKPRRLVIALWRGDISEVFKVNTGLIGESNFSHYVRFSSGMLCLSHNVPAKRRA